MRLDAIADNFRTVKQLACRANVAGVVKANGYGMGAAQVARSLAEAGCDTYFVARLEEGVSLRPFVPQARIFVLDGLTRDTVPALIAHRLTPVLNALAEIEALSAAASAGHVSLDAALHIDTGMNRLGLSRAEFATLSAETGTRLKGLNIVLAMSHLACADDPSAPMNEIQRDRFRAALAGLPPAPASLASSGGVLLGKDYIFDMVRPGLGLYGGNPQPRSRNPFKTVAVLSGRILQIRRVDTGESVGYGASFRAKHPMVLATIALGYADGLMRAIGNKGSGALAGRRIAVIGRVSMDLVTVDVTDIAPGIAATGSQVEFLGDTIRLEELAAAADTAAYEILTRLGERVPRRYAGGPVS